MSFTFRSDSQKILNFCHNILFFFLLDVPVSVQCVFFFHRFVTMFLKTASLVIFLFCFCSRTTFVLVFQVCVLITLTQENKFGLTPHLNEVYMYIQSLLYESFLPICSVFLKINWPTQC